MSESCKIIIEKEGELTTAWFSTLTPEFEEQYKRDVLAERDKEANK